jgi:hypothetical protein
LDIARRLRGRRLLFLLRLLVLEVADDFGGFELVDDQTCGARLDHRC